MKKDQWIGIILMIISILAMLVLCFILYSSEAGLKLEVFLLPALVFLVGLLIFFTDFESALNLHEIIDSLPQAIEDDLENIKSGQLTDPILFLLLSLVGFFVETGLIFYFRKWNAQWAGISVLLLSTIVVVVTAVLCFRSNWFKDRYYRLSRKIFYIPAIGFLICASIGPYFTEPIEFGRLSSVEQNRLSSENDYSQTSRSGQYIRGYSTGNSSTSNIDFDCDGDECLTIFLVVVVILCVLGSAFIPHFWLLAISLLLTIMIMVTLRELLYYERGNRGYYS